MPHDPKHQMLHARPNVQLIWQIYAALQLRDYDTIFALMSPEIEIEQSEELPWGGHYKGHDGARQFMEKLGASIESTVMLQHFIDAGETVVAVGRTQGMVTGSGIAFDVPISHVWTVRDGVAVHARYCIDHPTMMKALHGPESE